MQWFSREARDQRDNWFWARFVMAGIIFAVVVYFSLLGLGWVLPAILRAAG